MTLKARILIEAAFACALGAAVFFSMGLYEMRPAVKTKANPEVQTTVKRLEEVAGAVQAFRVTFGRWPDDLSQLGKNEKGVAFYSGPLVDAWGGKLIYEKPDPVGGFGKVQSLGKDARPGGRELARDFTVGVDQPN